MALHNKVGAEGEEQARNFLQHKGYVVRHINWRGSAYELDIVAELPGWLVVVEVKTRTSLLFEPAHAAVNGLKIKHIVEVADEYIQLFDIDKPVRFDIISVYKTSDSFLINHLEDAFFPPIN